MAKVPKSSGQGTSRKAYMSGWRASHPGGGPAVKTAGVTTDKPVAGRSYGKAGFVPPPGAMAIDYAPSVFNDVSNLKEVKAIGTEKTPKGIPKVKFLRPTRIEKFTKPLPARSTLNDLSRSQRTIQDYAKAIDDDKESMPAVLSFLAQRKRKP